MLLDNGCENHVIIIRESWPLLLARDVRVNNAAHRGSVSGIYRTLCVIPAYETAKRVLHL